jgi:hypothetical protein
MIKEPTGNGTLNNIQIQDRQLGQSNQRNNNTIANMQETVMH